MEQQHVLHERKFATLPQVLTGTVTEQEDEPGYSAQPDEHNRELLAKLREGMQDLAHLREPENADPNLQQNAMDGLNALRGQHGAS